MKIISYQTLCRISMRRISGWWPWGVSIAVHLSALGILSAMVLVSYNKNNEGPQIVPEARLGKVDPGLPLFQELGGDIPWVSETHFEKDLQEQIAPRVMNTSLNQSGAADGVDVIGIASEGLGKFFSSGGFDYGKDRGNSKLPGGDLTGLVPSASATKFFASAGNAYNVVYLVDRSASMTDCLEPLKRELKRSINSLGPMQKFHVIFFSFGKPSEGPASQLTWATDRNKSRYFKFIDTIIPQGQTDPQPALERALGLKPDLVYLLTDGIFSESITSGIITGAKAKKIKINTIAYVLESGGGALRRIAEQTGGIYKFVSGVQLQ